MEDYDHKHFLTEKPYVNCITERHNITRRNSTLTYLLLQITEIYNTVETHESLTECQEVTLVLENYLRDFNAMAEWFRLKWEYEKTPVPQRPTSLTWDICKTSLVKTNRSGKSTPSTGSGRTSPNVTGKVSPKNNARNKSISPNLLPKSNSVHNNKEGIERDVPCLDHVSESDVGKVIQPKAKSNSLYSPMKPSLLQISDGVEESVVNLNDVEECRIEDSSTTLTNTSLGNHEINAADGKVDNSREEASEDMELGKRVSGDVTKHNFCNSTGGVKNVENDVKSQEKVSEVTQISCELKADSKTDDSTNTNNNCLEHVSNIHNQKIIPQLIIDSPSEDQRTYDIFRKTGIQSAEKSTSTSDDFANYLKSQTTKKATAKVSQECQTDDIEKKFLKSDLKTQKTQLSARLAYSTALTKSVSSKSIAPIKKPDPVKQTCLYQPKVKIIRPSSKSTTLVSTQPPKSHLARSKTFSDIKQSKNIPLKPMFKLSTKPEPVNKTPIKTPERQRTFSGVTKSKLTTNSPKPQKSDGTISSTETLVNHAVAREHVGSSTEILNNCNGKSDSLSSDGWLTVKCRSRFKDGNGRARKLDSFSWATRFHQVSGTTSLPALALLPENNESKIVDKTVKDNLNTSLKNKDVKEHTQMKLNKNNALLKRSHTTLSKVSALRNEVRDKFNFKSNEKSFVVKERYNVKQKIADADFETDDEAKMRYVQDEMEHLQKTDELMKEEERLNEEIAQLQSLEIEIDTETDEMETDGELQLDNEYVGDKINEEDSNLSLEARYEPMLAGMYFVSF